MRVCDLTMAYNESSGGIRTYIDQKRLYLLEHTDHEHALIVPGEADAADRSGRVQTRWIKSPATGYGDYRLMWRPDAIAEALDAVQPDVIELATYLVCPWPAFRHRRQRQKSGERCVVAGYFHTDIAEAYVQSPLQEKLTHVTEWEPIAEAGEQVAELIGHGAEHYFGRIFSKCDLLLAASPAQSQRLTDYGVEPGVCVPMGVDAEVFTPENRDAEQRRQWNAGAETCVLIFAGRLSEEKRVHTIVEAYRKVAAQRDTRLILIGEGPFHKELAEMAETDDGWFMPGYVSDPQRVARMLASADVYVTAGPYETFGISVVEAQASGLPVVGVDAGALRERVTDGTGALGPVDDADAMANHIQQAWANRQTWGDNARQHVNQHYTWQRSFAKLVNAYEQAHAKAV